MIPMTPSGMRILPTQRSLGRRHIFSTSPTGSGRAINSSIPAAICSIRSSERVSLSSMAPESPRDAAASRSFRFCSRSHGVFPRSPLAMAARGVRLAGDGPALGAFLPPPPLHLLARPRRDPPGEFLSPRVADGDGIPPAEFPLHGQNPRGQEAFPLFPHDPRSPLVHAGGGGGV